MKKFEQTCSAIRKACKKTINDYDNRLTAAMGTMDRNHCTLHVVDYRLYNEIDDVITGYCREHHLDPFNYTVDDIIRA
jgi:hypothetical protein